MVRFRRPSPVGLAVFLAVFAVGVAAPVEAQTAETLILFNPAVPETPESIVFDRHDNAYITLALTGEIRKIAPDGSQTSLAFLPIGAPCGSGAFTVALGLALDLLDRLYVAVAACNPANQGVWRVDKAPELQPCAARVATLSAELRHPYDLHLRVRLRRSVA